MRYIQEYEALLHNIFGKFIGKYFEGYLVEIFDFLGVLVATLLAYWIIKLVFSVLGPGPEPDWKKIDPGNPVHVTEGFNDLHIVVSLSNRLGVNTSNTLDEFRDQLYQVKKQNSV